MDVAATTEETNVVALVWEAFTMTVAVAVAETVTGTVVVAVTVLMTEETTAAALEDEVAPPRIGFTTPSTEVTVTTLVTCAAALETGTTLVTTAATLDVVGMLD